jgi:PEGA domain
VNIHLRVLYCLLLFAASTPAQDQKPAAHAPMPGAKPSGPCVILKRMGPADEITSHLYSFGIRGKQFQYVEGDLPQGISFHGRLTDHDVRKILDKGGKVQVVEPKYTTADLERARNQCSALFQADASPAQRAQTNSPPSDALPGSVSQAKPSGTDAQLDVTSTPPGADVELDGNFVGDTPSNIGVSPGDHAITITKKGYSLWEKKIKVSSGKVNISAELEAATETKAATPLVESAPAQGSVSANVPEDVGSVSVTSDPSGADVYVDDSLVGKTPATLKLKPGQHYVRLFMKGYTNWSQQVTVGTGSETNLAATLTKLN